MPEAIVPLVAVVSLFIGLPIIIVGSILGGRFLKIKERELLLRERELDIERERIEVVKLVKANEVLDRADEIKRR